MTHDQNTPASEALKGTPLISVRSLHKRFVRDGDVLNVLSGIDLDIHPGEMLSVVGPSGAGKSTLLNLLGTLDFPSAGQVLYENKDVSRLSSNQLSAFRNRTIGFVFQFHHLLPDFNAVENVMMPGLIGGMRRSRCRERALALLEQVGLSKRLSHQPGELSGGEQQRVALARSLVMSPRVVLADEPTGNLDSRTSEAIHELILELNQSSGTTFLVVTHSRDLASRMARTVSMKDGKVFYDGPREGDTEAEPASARATGWSDDDTAAPVQSGNEPRKP